MTEQRERRLSDRVADPGYLEGLNDLLMERLQEMRTEVQEVENDISFERRLCQARIDILSAELDRRSGQGEGDLLARLPQILASELSGGDKPLPDRAPDFSIPRNADVPRRRVEEIAGEQTLARLPHTSPEEIKSTIASLAEHERAVSARRRKIHEVMDAVQGEIVRRYVTGEADPTAALS